MTARSDWTRSEVCFDDERAVADAGIVLVSTLAARLGLEGLVEECVDLGERPGAPNPGAKVMTLVSAIALGADCIDDCDILRSGSTAHAVRPSGDGAVDAGHVSARVYVRACATARSRSGRESCAGVGGRRGTRRGGLVVDVDSFVGEVHGYAKQGAGFGTPASVAITRSWPPVLTPARCCTSAVAKGSANTARGALRFVEELIPRVDRAGATGPKLLRADSGFWNKIMARLLAAGWEYSIGVRQQPISARRSPRSTMRTGSRWPTTPRPARRRSPRRSSATVSVWSCGARVCSAPRPSCGPSIGGPAAGRGCRARRARARGAPSYFRRSTRVS
jgi:hypothetical protein